MADRENNSKRLALTHVFARSWYQSFPKVFLCKGSIYFICYWFLLVPVGSRWFPLVPVGSNQIGSQMLASRTSCSHMIGPVSLVPVTLVPVVRTSATHHCICIHSVHIARDHGGARPDLLLSHSTCRRSAVGTWLEQLSDMAARCKRPRGASEHVLAMLK